MSMANRINPSRKQGRFTRSLIAAALAEAILMGSAVANGADVQSASFADSYDVAITDEADVDSNDADDVSPYANSVDTWFPMGTAPRNAVMLDEIEDPKFAAVGELGLNTASLNNTDVPSATALAVGVSSVASGGNTVALGLGAVAASDNSVAIGSNVLTNADQPYSVSVGSDVMTAGTQAVALGAHVQANADNALVVGNNYAMALGNSSIAIGDGATVRSRAESSIAMGTSANVAGSVANAMALGANSNVAVRADRSIALGAGANVAAGAYDSAAMGAGASVVANAYGSIALGAGSIADRVNALSIGSLGAERQIINVAPGTQLTDGVNVSQLKGVTDALGAGAGIGPDGSIVQPEFTVFGNKYFTVEQAIQAAASSGATDSLAVRYDLNDDGSANYGSVTLGGPASAPVILTNVADGKNPYDAVNFGQLSALQGQVDNLNQTVTSIGDRVS